MVLKTSLFSDYHLLQAWKRASLSSKQKVLFGASTALGTILFLLLCESLLRIISLAFVISQNYAFIASYIISYILSILWQHSLNRLLIPNNHKDKPYCHQFSHTFMAYFISLLLSALIGGLLLSISAMQSHIISMITLTIGGICSFKILQYLDSRAIHHIDTKAHESV
uniref:GtrA-like protein domain-containing protein n=1 Tax=Spongospora subterranea TaxID=70186 RepID=A0A0H5RSH9_9EUKA|eukprot:CRZ11694.1 hypothetical protein [Spongospora subterranea]